MRNAQVSVEFMFMVIAATAMILVFMVVFSEAYQDNFTDKKMILMEDYGYALQNEFFLASKSRPGYTRILEIPDNLEGYDYEVSIIGTTLLINYTTNTLALQIPEVNGTIVKGNNRLIKHNDTICLNC